MTSPLTKGKGVIMPMIRINNNYSIDVHYDGEEVVYELYDSADDLVYETDAYGSAWTITEDSMRELGYKLIGEYEDILSSEADRYGN